MATAGNGRATVAFTTPDYDGGSAIMSYTATSSPRVHTETISQQGSGIITVTGLNNGESYTFTVTATNGAGTSAPSASSNTITPIVSTVPDAPTIGAATATNGQATVAFTAPGLDGGSTITTYTATSDPGELTGTISQSGDGTIIVTGLTNNLTYTFTVIATNANGNSLPSASSNTVRPTASPAIIGEFRAGGLVFWVDPTDNTHGLVCAVSNQSNATWGCEGTPISATSAAIGTGNANTDIIIAGCATPSIAARICADLTRDGYSDWFLPSKDELNEMSINRVVINNAASNQSGGGSFGNNYFWSSTHGNSNHAADQNFHNGIQSSGKKSWSRSVRAIRAF